MTEEGTVAAVAFDKTINLGHLLTIGGIMCAAVGLGFTVRQDITQVTYETKALSEKVGNIEGKVDKVTDVLITLGKQEVRLDSLEKRLFTLERPTIELPVSPRRR